MHNRQLDNKQLLIIQEKKIEVDKVSTQHTAHAHKYKACMRYNVRRIMQQRLLVDLIV